MTKTKMKFGIGNKANITMTLPVDTSGGLARMGTVKTVLNVKADKADLYYDFGTSSAKLDIPIMKS